uniref:Uncharacterized protein n=1 Tax=viral metagenome TaxID=1070528 RepID=A0A6M3IU85_9ZZZZ
MENELNLPEPTNEKVEPGYDLMQSAGSDYMVQVETAKRHPRNIPQSYSNIKAIATMSMDTAMACGYMVPRDGKQIRGASVHLARIILQNWGNIRVTQQVVGEEANFVICEAVAWDMETNVAIKTQVKRRIVKKDGERYSIDGIQTTGNAGMAIALRNSIFAIVPRTIVDGAYQATRRLIEGDLSDDDKVTIKRKELILLYQSRWGIAEKQIFSYFGYSSITQIKKSDLVSLIELNQSFKDGEAIPDQVFSETVTDRAKRVVADPTKADAKKPEPKLDAEPEPETKNKPEQRANDQTGQKTLM